MAVTFQPLLREHFELLACWLREPLVARWWCQETSREAIEREFGAAVDGREPTDLFMALDDGLPAGMLQRYPIHAYEEYLRELCAVWPVPPGAVGFDYLIGVPELRGRGLGAEMVAALAVRSWEELPHANDVVIAVAAGNRASWRTLERAGFERVAQGPMTPDNPADPPEHLVYRLGRPVSR